MLDKHSYGPHSGHGRDCHAEGITSTHPRRPCYDNAIVSGRLDATQGAVSGASGQGERGGAVLHEALWERQSEGPGGSLANLA
ncbi:hypothetical protein E2C01_068774 [Portunus trituberculatus]|uniref:Uncharacterized protein n=1 Tax=Portunus trituberculatus TaxID=210409 RepID=A0A5B7HXG0_PORTR|nr:hypothetical protein [Portunus trituberculatus]